jgi:uncharacterized protein (TIGR02246 family)
MDVLEKLVAESEIRQLLGRYCQCTDDGNAEEWAGLFAEEGAFITSSGRIEGRNALREWQDQVLKSARMRHLMVNPVILVDSPDSARSRVDLQLLKADDDKWSVLAIARYNDRLVKTTEGWRFLERVATKA